MKGTRKEGEEMLVDEVKLGLTSSGSVRADELLTMDD